MGDESAKGAREVTEVGLDKGETNLGARTVRGSCCSEGTSAAESEKKENSAPRTFVESHVRDVPEPRWTGSGLCDEKRSEPVRNAPSRTVDRAEEDDD